MRYVIKKELLLRKLLWADALMGSVTAAVGLAFSASLAPLLGLSTALVTVVAAVNLMYALFAFSLTQKTPLPIKLVRTLINANWAWAGISVLMLLFHMTQATALGLAFLVLQIPVVGGLAYVEGRQLVKVSV